MRWPAPPKRSVPASLLPCPGSSSGCLFRIHLFCPAHCLVPRHPDASMSCEPINFPLSTCSSCPLFIPVPLFTAAAPHYGPACPPHCCHQAACHHIRSASLSFALVLPFLPSTRTWFETASRSANPVGVPLLNRAVCLLLQRPSSVTLGRFTCTRTSSYFGPATGIVMAFLSLPCPTSVWLVQR